MFRARPQRCCGSGDQRERIRTRRAIIARSRRCSSMARSNPPIGGTVSQRRWTRATAGVLNVFNSWSQLHGGKHPFIETTSVINGNPHPPGANPATRQKTLSSWDLNSLTNADPLRDHVVIINAIWLHDSMLSPSASPLVWLRPPDTGTESMPGVNDLNLFLAANGNLILSSTSAVDNVEHCLRAVAVPPRASGF